MKPLEVWSKHAVALSTFGALTSVILAMAFIGTYLAKFDTQLIYLVSYGDLIRFWVSALGLTALLIGVLVASAGGVYYFREMQPILKFAFASSLRASAFLFVYYFLWDQPKFPVLLRIAILVVFINLSFSLLSFFSSESSRRSVYYASIFLGNAVLFSGLLGHIYALKVERQGNVSRTLEFQIGDDIERHEKIVLIMVTEKFVVFSKNGQTLVRKSDALNGLLISREPSTKP